MPLRAWFSGKISASQALVAGSIPAARTRTQREGERSTPDCSGVCRVSREQCGAAQDLVRPFRAQGAKKSSARCTEPVRFRKSHAYFAEPEKGRGRNRENSFATASKSFVIDSRIPHTAHASQPTTPQLSNPTMRATMDEFLWLLAPFLHPRQL